MALGFHDVLEVFPDTAFSSRTVRDNISRLFRLIHGIGRNNSDSGGKKHRNIEKVISEKHHLRAIQTMSAAEIVEIGDFVARSEIYVLRRDSIA